MSLDQAGQSIPKRCGRWSDIMGAYRLLSNEAVDPQEIQRPHRTLTREACDGVVLAVADITDLDYTAHRGKKGLGKLGDGRGRGLQQHTVLAVDPDAGAIGLLDQRWSARPESPKGETRRQRQSRWCESDVWSDAVRTIGHPPMGCRLIHVADRGGDNFAMIDACYEQGAGFLIRAMHDRRVGKRRLWEIMESRAVVDRIDVAISAQRSGLPRDRRSARTACVAVRTGTVEISAPMNDPRSTGKPSHTVHVVHVREEHPPTETEPLEWMLLSSEPAESGEDARRLVNWYARRWVIEEFHRIEKEGCRLEQAQLDDAHDIMRLAAITAIVALRLMQLRDLASENDEASLKETASPEWIAMVATLGGVLASDMTARQFWHTIARQGGWIGRASDPRPGWKCIWRGWSDINLMVRGAQLANLLKTAKRCV